MITGISKSAPSALQMDTESSTLFSDFSVTAKGFTTKTSVTKSDAVAGHDVAVRSLTRANPVFASNPVKYSAKKLDPQNKTQELQEIRSLQAQLA